MNNVGLNGSCVVIPQRSLDETLTVSCTLPLGIYAHSRAMAIIKQLQFHMACSFETAKEKRGGGKSLVVKKSKCANIDAPFSKCSPVQLGMSSTYTTTKASHFHLTEMKMEVDQLLSFC